MRKEDFIHFLLGFLYPPQPFLSVVNLTANMDGYFSTDKSLQRVAQIGGFEQYLPRASTESSPNKLNL